jgi:hypothetical protein
MTKIKADPRVYTKPAPAKEKPVAQKAAPKAASGSKPAGPKRRKA